MYLQEIIIEGFKSYAHKTVVSGFDPQFNAITGLNGTGKSNILDSICFVLGITNLSQVRAGNLQELVYKQGQAGVTKATVTVVFNNSDVATSPVGYESHKQITVTRQVVIGGKNKYMVNGRTVQQNELQNLFHSVQLNINNPHFLIMQGRITKVLNMKPPEILSMIQEASGTRMFESKKEAAIKTIEKKQLKVDEITNCMDAEIMPTLEKLRGERQSYLTWQSNNSELERLERFCIAVEYKRAEEKLLSSEDDKREILNQIDDFEKTQREKQEEADICVNKIKEIENLRNENMEGEFQQLKKNEADLSKKVVRLNTLSNNQNESLSNEKESLSVIKKQIDALSKLISSKGRELSQQTDIVTAKEREYTEAENESMKLREKYQNAFAGLANDEDSNLLSLPEQLATLERKLRESQSQLQQNELYIKHSNDKLTELKSSLKSQNNSHEESIQEIQKHENSIAKLNEKLAVFSSSLNKASSSASSSTVKDFGYYQSRESELKSNLSNLNDNYDKLSANVESRLNFEYTNPEKGFDRNRVKGLVAKLIDLNDSEVATALEIAAGAKLYQVVVDSEQTGKALLQKGQLKKRVTILPLNKLEPQVLDSTRLSNAKSIASRMNGKASLAIELVQFSKEVAKAMEYTFGNVIICDKPDVAKAVAFDKSVRNKVVTYDGDSYDPSGTLSGGAKNQLGVLLNKIFDLRQLKNKISSTKYELILIQKEINTLESNELEMKEILNKLELANHLLSLAKEKLSSSTFSQIQSEISALEIQLSGYQTESANINISIKKAKEELKNLKSLEVSAKMSRENALKEMEKLMKSATKVASELKSQLAKMKSKRDTINAEVESLNTEVEGLNEQSALVEANLNQLTEESNSFARQLTKSKEAYELAKQTVAEKQQELNQCSTEIKQLSVQQEKCLKAVTNASLESRKCQHKLKQWEKDHKDAGKVVNNLEKQYPWVEQDKIYFGVEGSDYDFQARDIDQSMKRHKQLKADQEKLSKKINKKVMGMIEKAESEYEDLRRKKEVILNDKSKIEAVIEELDVKKSQALQTTWIKVNRDFGSIFSMLLPGTHAKLEPPEGLTVNEGLEVKVAFNGVWKDSLTELSGGQRSLLALSLILSLLLFKPAPMYILDEVDAALDLSHTQNIGLMLRTHFSKSQFIVVSLKEGMFNNANVIFRTKFIDGVSTVTRTVVNGRSKVSLIENNVENEVDRSEPQKKKGKGTKNEKQISKVDEVPI